MNCETLQTGEDQLYPGSREHLLDTMLGNDTMCSRYLTYAQLYFSRQEIDTGGRAFQRFGLICGPTNGVFARLLSNKTGIPLRDNGEDEHLELDVAYYRPKDNDVALIGDHTYIRYHTGSGYVGYIDAVHSLLWGGVAVHRDRVQELINYRMYPAGNFDEQLANDYCLFPYDQSTPPEIWQHPLIDPDLCDPGKLARFKQRVNQPDLPDYEWKGPAIKLLAKMGEDDAWNIQGTSYRRPQYEPFDYSAYRLEFEPGFSLPTLASVTAGISRQRYAQVSSDAAS